jgi:hypothetical protein
MTARYASTARYAGNAGSQRESSGPLEGAQTFTEPAPTAKPATPYHCPFCGDEDLRPVEDHATAWSCRSCARVFTVGLVRIEQSLIPGLSPGRADGRSGAFEPEGPE